MTHYKHTQVGYLMLIVTVVLTVFYVWLYKIIPRGEVPPGIILIMVLILLLLASFSTLMVSIDEKNLRVKFGFGIYTKKFPLSEILSAQTAKNHWYFGWGIRVWLWPKMIIYNVSGFDAVEIKMKNGKIYRIGTDVPQELERAINQAINS